MDIWSGINIPGIVLEIFGFVLILKATGILKREEAGFQSGTEHIENFVSITCPRFYKIGIYLVIIGLAIQIIPSAVSIIID